jgi:hypothetical protein
MARRRTDYKPADFVRCTRCRRLLLRSEATFFDGGQFGPECVQRAFSAANNDPVAAELRRREQERGPIEA